MYKTEIIIPSLSIANFSEFNLLNSVYQLSGSAIFTAYQKNYADLLRVKQALKPHLKAQIKINDQLALSGFVADVKPCYQDGLPVLIIKINSPASKLAGASIENGKYYLQQSAAAIVADIVKTYGLSLVVKTPKADILPEFSISAGEDIDVILNQLAKLSNTLIYSDPAGNLVMADKCAEQFTRSALVTGSNIIDFSMQTNTHNQFSQVCLHTQKPLYDNFSLEEIIDSSLFGSSQGQGRCKHKTVDFLSSSLLEAEISELENGSFDCRVVGSSFLDTDAKLLEINHPLLIKNDWTSINEVFRMASVAFSYQDNAYQSKIELERINHAANR